MSINNNAVNRDDFNAVMVPNYVPDNFIPVRGEGVYVWDQAGNKYLDFTSGVAVCALGHCHPELQRVLREQAANLWHISNIYTNEPALKLAKHLIDVTCADRVFFANSGAEVNEAAFKLARRYATSKYGEHKHRIISMQNSFHGRTLFTVNVGGQPRYAHGFGPKIAGIDHVPFNDIEALEQVISVDTCAVVLELVQGESGVLPVADDYIKEVRRLCNKYRALLIIDEVQTGIGRTGKLFAHEYYDIKPDIFTSSKGLGGGFPIGAMLTTNEVAGYLPAGTHGSTFGGNPLACAVADKVLELVNNPDLLANVVKNGAFLQQKLLELNDKHQMFKQVRGKGLLVGALLSDDLVARAADIRQFAAAQGLMILQAGISVLRFAPALIISQDEIMHGCELLDLALTKFKRN